MDKRDSEIRMFDGTKFPVWKFYMELCFSTKEVMPIVDGTVPQPGEDASEAEKAAWLKGDNLPAITALSLPGLTFLQNNRQSQISRFDCCSWSIS